MYRGSVFSFSTKGSNKSKRVLSGKKGSFANIRWNGSDVSFFSRVDQMSAAIDAIHYQQIYPKS